MNCMEQLKTKAALVENALQQLLPDVTVAPGTIHHAMRYSCLGGGKRLRAVLAMEACRAVGGRPEDVIDFACAIEMIHAYSLVHDDLPAMDNDDYRRGKLANHKVFGEGIAILTGDALLTYAFEVLAKMQHLNSELVLRLVQEVSSACGSQGLIGGQVVDLESEGKAVDLSTLEFIHRNKTGKLFMAALRGGALIGGADEQQLALITAYGENFGLAFQITDDILDVVGNAAKLGKVTGSDQRQAKSTYVSIFGLDEARRMAQECISKCKSYAAALSVHEHCLGEIADYVLGRES